MDKCFSYLPAASSSRGVNANASYYILSVSPHQKFPIIRKRVGWEIALLLLLVVLCDWDRRSQ